MIDAKYRERVLCMAKKISGGDFSQVIDTVKAVTPKKLKQHDCHYAFQFVLHEILQKSASLHRDGFTEAAAAAKELHDSLSMNYEKWQKHKCTAQEFKTAAVDCIIAAKPALEKQRGWKKRLDFLVTLVNFFVRKINSHSLFAFKTKSIEKLNEINRYLDNLAPAQQP
jgi:hypothetical protein